MSRKVFTVLTTDKRTVRLNCTSRNYEENNLISRKNGRVMEIVLERIEIKCKV
jgi:hypothetical protein